ncbi:LAME_0E06722g1_1 [Lachancea meyersii CBS 8951]|uniref:LAME_0E06722g1_1 n=1 Tax=Lachancea meyersii CBS 8951 TaxID=1266667 RepID=A0A1G4JI72_9SACH|nr:LAME_0E06722g1_1 [Lachancea meyersii CBS 8951]
MSLEMSTMLRPTKTLGLWIWDEQLAKRDTSSSGTATSVSESSSASSSASSSENSSASATATSSGSGCVTCPSTPACPVCPDDEQCALSIQQCDQCPQTYCAKKNGSLGSVSSSSAAANATTTSVSGSKSNSARIGGIVGGVIGGVGLVVILLLLYLYAKYWRKNRTRNKDVLVAREEYAGDFDESAGGHQSDLQTQGRGSLYIPRNRSSAATQITKASNILPIAYIPGVTAGGRSQNKLPPLPRHLLRNGDTRSHITLGSSILGGDDDNDLEVEAPTEGESPIILEKPDANGSRENLTTAIRARPKLVQINEEDDEETEEKEGDFGVQDPEHSTSGLHRENEKDRWVTTAIIPSSGESSRQEDIHGEEHELSDQEGDDDDGSFILDVGME